MDVSALDRLTVTVVVDNATDTLSTRCSHPRVAPELA